MTRTIGIGMLWNSIGSLFYFGCQWLLTVFVVRLNGGYWDAGILTLAMSIATPLSTVAMLNLRTFQVANVNKCFSDGDFILTRVVTSTVALAICIVVAVGSHYNFYTSVCIVLFMVYRLSEASVDVLHGIDQRAWRLDIVGKSFLLRGSIMLIAFIIGEYFFRSLPLSIVLMGIAVYGVILFYDIPTCKKNVSLNLTYKRENVVPLIKIGIPLGAFAFLLNLLSSIPKIFLESWHGEEVLGIFGSITTITVLVPQLASFVFSPLVPIFAECWESHNKKSFNRLFAICILDIALIGGAASVCGYFWGEWGLGLIFGDSIRQYSHLLCPVIGTAIITACIWLVGSLLTIFEDYRMLAWLSLVSVFGSLAVSELLIKESALAGTILSTTIGLLMELALLGTRMVFVMRKEGTYDAHM